MSSHDDILLSKDVNEREEIKNKNTICDSQLSFDEWQQKSEELIELLINLENNDIQSVYDFIESNFKNGRLIYSTISNKIYNLNSLEYSNLEYACDLLISYSEEQKKTDVSKIILKFIDHINLALSQERFIQRYNIEDYKESFDKVDEFMKRSSDLNNKIENMNAQVITALGIFTAIAFILFGGISSAASILEKMNNPSVGHLMIFCGIWGLTIYNAVYFLIYFISKLAKINIKTNTAYNASIFRRHPYICVMNYILFSVTILGIWIYIIESSVGGNWFKIIVDNNKDFLTAGTFVIILMIIFGAIFLIHKICDSSKDW